MTDPKPVKRYYRSLDDRKLAGLAGGLGELMNVDPTLIRLLFVLLFVVTGFVPMLVAYLVGWMIVPEAPAGPVRQGSPPPAAPAEGGEVPPETEKPADSAEEPAGR